mmetsp:Transcript_2764/g.7699  ORF Transcript_2764/g.7699 Transcript_2764/m.7699 type:complete len:90 (+) Transcript_2764:2449-2718(+)
MTTSAAAAMTTVVTSVVGGGDDVRAVDGWFVIMIDCDQYCSGRGAKDVQRRAGWHNQVYSLPATSEALSLSVCLIDNTLQLVCASRLPG